MSISAWTNKVIALWLFSILNFIAVLLLPASFAAVANEVGDSLEPLIVFYFFLTCVMIWLTLVLTPAVSRWFIMLVGVFFAFVKIQWIVYAATHDSATAMLFNELWGLLVALMLVWYGWKSPEREGKTSDV